MKVRVERELTSGGIEESTQFDLSREDASHIMTILRDTLYSDRILAVLREYSANAWDAHRMVGKADLPIKVTLPTEMDPKLTIRDFGPGLSRPDVFNVYTKYGKSTKRDTDNAVGMLGIGCLRAGQPIVTSEGVKPVEAIEVGDLVLTHKGRFRPVTELMRRPYQGRAFRVYLSQCPTPLVLTEEHPIYVHDGVEASWKLPSEIVGGYRSQKKGIDSWNSYAMLPATMEEGAAVLDVSSVMGEGFVFEDGVLTHRTEFRNTRNGKEHSKLTARVTTYPEFPSSLPLDEELGWALGIFAAEGSTTDKQVTLSLNIEETDIAARFNTFIQQTFGIEFTHYSRPEKSILELVAHSKALAFFFSELCGKGARNKRVPEQVMLGTDAVRCGFLRGVLEGDGSSTRQRFVFGVASPDLAWGVRTLMASVDDKWGSVGCLLPKHERWSVQYNGEAAWSYCKREGDYLLRPITKVEEFNLISEVFNFSVDEDESYVSDFILHNCKSAFAYADSFTVTSWHAGKKSVYVAVLDKSDKGTMNLMHEEDCDPSETGIEIQIAVEQKDVEVFHSRAKSLFQHFIPRPKINTTLPVLPTEMYKLTSGFLYVDKNISYDDKGWTAVMGCVPYRIDMNKIRDVTPGIAENLYDLSGALHFDIGEVQINASREELKYSDMTKRAIVNKVNTLVDEFVQEILSRLKQAKSPWDKRIGADVLRRLRLTALADDVMKERYVELPKDKDEPKTFYLTEGTSTKHVGSIPVDINTRLLIHDSPRAMNGYDLSSYDRIVRKKSGADEAALLKELDEVLEKLELTGIPIKKLSEMDWEKVYIPKGRGSTGSVKHAKRLFSLKDRPSFRHPWSDDWETIDHEPSAKDVFVLLDRFQAYGSFADHLRQDKIVCEFFKIPFPKVLGYKTTEKKPVDAKDCKGSEYRKWREALYKKLPQTAWMLELYAWTKCERIYFYRDGEKRRYNALPEKLGENHPIVLWLQDRKKADKAWNKLPHTTQMAIKALSKMADQNPTAKPRNPYGDDEEPPEGSEAGRRYQALKDTYPLLLCRRQSGLDSLWDDKKDAPLWIDYVQLTDKVSATLTTEQDNDAEDPVHADQRVDQPGREGDLAHGPQERPELRAAP